MWQAIDGGPKGQQPQVDKSRIENYYTVVEQAGSYANMATTLGEQFKTIINSFKGEHKTRLENEPTFAKFFKQLGESTVDSLQHPQNILKSIYEGNKQMFQSVEDEFETKPVGPHSS